MDLDRAEPCEANGFQAGHAGLILGSHARLTGRALLPAGIVPSLAHALYHAPFVVLAHDTAADPVFFYANLTAQHLFEMSWDEMVRLPSRFSAEPMQREARQRLLDRVSAQGYIDDYSGVRVSATGRRFHVSHATVWNLVDEAERMRGQAAWFDAWTPAGNPG